MVQQLEQDAELWQELVQHWREQEKARQPGWCWGAGVKTRQKGLEHVEDPRMGVFPSWPSTAQAEFAKRTRAPSMHKLFHLHADAGMQPAEPTNGNTSSAGLLDCYQRGQHTYFSTQIKLYLCLPDSLSLLLVPPRCDGCWVVAERRKEGKETQMPSPEPPGNTAQGDALPPLTCWGMFIFPCCAQTTCDLPTQCHLHRIPIHRLEPSSSHSPPAAPLPCCHSSPVSSHLIHTTPRPPCSSLQAWSDCPKGQSLPHTGTCKVPRVGTGPAAQEELSLPSPVLAEPRSNTHSPRGGQEGQSS